MGCKPVCATAFPGASHYLIMRRNAALGLGDGDDRAFPEQVTIPFQKELENEPFSMAKLRSVQVKGVAMSKLHTSLCFHRLIWFVLSEWVYAVVITNEPKGNLRLCGFGNGGRFLPFSFRSEYAIANLKSQIGPRSTYTIRSCISPAIRSDHRICRTGSGPHTGPYRIWSSL